MLKFGIMAFNLSLRVQTFHCNNIIEHKLSAAKSNCFDYKAVGKKN